LSYQPVKQEEKEALCRLANFRQEVVAHHLDIVIGRQSVVMVHQEEESIMDIQIMIINISIQENITTIADIQENTDHGKI
jgi:hypothetical protein